MDLPNPDNLCKPPYQTGDIIRRKEDGHPYRVVHIFKKYGTILIDLFDANPLATTLTLKPSHYDQFAKDHEMQLNKDEFIYRPINI